VPRIEVIRELVPQGSRWWVAFGPLPVIAMLWAYEVRQYGGFAQVRGFLADDEPAAPG